ncbi:MAG: methyltransferase domain-containing protein [Acidobacteria bacterium]|nr:methyltransferase domain-containing protein [Acidobacteriota bacterium]
MKRRPTPELLDSDAGTAEEVRASLRDLESFNRLLGGVTTTRELIHAVAGRTEKTTLSMLEVAAGNGLVPAVAADRLRSLGITLRTTLLDRARTHLPSNGASLKVVAEALKLPFADFSFDLVSSTLFLHHLPPQEVVEFVRESLRVSRIAVLVNDLIRHSVHLALAYAGLPLYRSRITRHDAPASVKQAYTPGEMRELLLRGGASKVTGGTRFLFRMGLVAWK